MAFIGSAVKWGLHESLGLFDKKKTDPYAALMNQLQPLIDEQKKISGQAGDQGLSDASKASGDYDYVTKYLKTFLTGSDDELLKQFDVSGATKNIDENEQQLSEQGVRGGARAASLGQSYFDRDASINRILQQIRQSAPDKIAQIAQAQGNLGTGLLSSALGGGAAASQNIFGIEGIKQADADRRAALISSILSAIGGTAGALAGAGVFGGGKK